MCAALMVLLQNFLNICGDSNHDVSGLFHHFHYFFIFNSFGDTICSSDQHGLVPNILSTSSFILADFLQPCRVQWRK